MFRYLRLATFISTLAVWATTSAQDTVVVQTLTFDSITTRRGTWEFPPANQQYRKILMYYTLKCDQQTQADQYACGEWDYLTYSNIYDHTGVLDSTALEHDQFLVGAEAPSSIELLNNVVHNRITGLRYNRIMNNTVNETDHIVGTGGTIESTTFNTASAKGRSQYLFLATELQSAGLQAGAIDKLRFNVQIAGGTIKELKVRMKHSMLSNLSTFVDTNLSTHFHNNLTFSGSGVNTLVLTQAFNWDGVSNILMDLSYSNNMGNSSSSLFATDAGNDLAITAADQDGYLSFMDDHISVPVGAFSNLSNEVTVSFWQYGDPAVQPINNYSFEALNAAGQRVLNVHLPWSNGRVYWDAGNNGGSYDRIDKQAATADYEGQWNHWAFTKNAATGVMRIYLNGQLWHSGSNNTWTMEDIAEFRIGSRGNGSGGFYAGSFDEFRIWNKELDASTIAAWMNKEVNDSHPEWAQLLYYFKFNEEEDSFVAINEVNPALNGALIGAPTRQYFDATNMTKGGIVGQLRPDIAFVQGQYTTSLDSSLTEILVAQSGKTKVGFQVVGNTVEPIDTLNGWQAGYYYWYQEDGTLYDSTMSDPGTVYQNSILQYYGAPFEVIDQYEIGRFITPYGIQLSLGAQGFRWMYDVTDYAWLLHDSVDFSSGNQQELIDVEFLMIEGTPPRAVKKMDRIWGQRSAYSYSDLDNDVVLFDTTHTLHPDATQWKVLTRFTGHGQNSSNGNYPHCCEWKNNTHYLYVNQQQVADWHIWQENDCANNPVYPQGGTWVGSREGWCPGDVVKDNAFEITQYISGNTVSIDYDITDVPSNNLGMGSGNYRVAMQLFHYGPATNTLDAELYEVLQPTDWEYRERWNPICIEPTVVLRNAGATTLTSALFTYSVSGGTPLTYTWNGNLPHMGTVNVELPIPDGSFWIGDGQNNFNVSVSEPNGGTDEYSFNNSYTSHFDMPDVYPTGGLVVFFKTNNRPFENSYTIRDINGNVVYAHDNLSANTLYKDSVYLWDGCYTFHFEDTGNDGLDYWANPAQGSGYLRLRKLDGGNLKYFTAEFGRDIHHAFSIGGVVGLQEYPNTQKIKVYPNPSNGTFNISATGIGGQVQVLVLDALGRTVLSKRIVLNDGLPYQLELGDQAPGIYLLRITTDEGELDQRIIKN